MFNFDMLNNETQKSLDIINQSIKSVEDEINKLKKREQNLDSLKANITETLKYISIEKEEITKQKEEIENRLLGLVSEKKKIVPESTSEMFSKENESADFSIKLLKSEILTEISQLRGIIEDNCKQIKDCIGGSTSPVLNNSDLNSSDIKNEPEKPLEKEFPVYSIKNLKTSLSQENESKDVVLFNELIHLQKKREKLFQLVNNNF